MTNKGYVRIKLNHSKENKAKGFYILITSGDTYSDKKNEFMVKPKSLSLLKKGNVDYDIVAPKI